MPFLYDLKERMLEVEWGSCRWVRSTKLGWIKGFLVSLKTFSSIITKARNSFYNLAIVV